MRCAVTHFPAVVVAAAAGGGRSVLASLARPQGPTGPPRHPHRHERTRDVCTSFTLFKASKVPPWEPPMVIGNYGGNREVENCERQFSTVKSIKGPENVRCPWPGESDFEALDA